MGTVFKARQPKLDRFVALKLLDQPLASEGALAERFHREARLLARLSHPGIVSVYNYGEAGGFFYLLMEFDQTFTHGKFGLVPSCDDSRSVVPVDSFLTKGDNMTVCKLENQFSAVLNRSLILAGAVVAALSLQAQETPLSKAQEHTSGKGDTASCIKEAAQMNMGVIKIAQLGSSKAQNSELKEFSQQLETDHKKAQDKLETIAKKHDVTLPTSLDAKCQEELTKLQGKSGTEFDKAFAKGAVQGHAMAVAKLQEASTDVQDGELKAYVTDMLAKVKEHQKQAREVAKAVGLDQATIASLERVPPEGVGTAGPGTQTERGTVTPQPTEPRQPNESTPRP